MKYPISPEYIKNAPDALARLYLSLEAFILSDICDRIKHRGDLTSTAIEEIRLLKKRGYSQKDIEKYLKRVLKLSDKELERLLQGAVNDNQRYYKTVLNSETLFDQVFTAEAIQQEINAIFAQTQGTMQNITQSMGFSVLLNGQRIFLPAAKAYQQVLDNAEIKVWSGAQSYNEAIRGAVKELTDSGLRTVTYDNDGKARAEHIDVAVRRAVMTGITQISAKYSDAISDQIKTNYFEVSAHRGARDVDKPNPWSNHKKWQGKVYSTKHGDIYPNIRDVCGLGAVDGLTGVFCRHMYYPFWEGISERTYTDQELQEIDPEPFEYKGQTYTAYQASQKMRSIERQLRSVKRDLIGFKANGDTEAYQLAAYKYKRLNDEYNDFSKVSGERKQERGNIAEFGPKEARDALKAYDKNTVAASTFVNSKDDLFENAKHVKPLEGYEDIVVHGDKYGFVFSDSDGVESNISVVEFADIIRSSGLWKGGAIRLLCCEAGADGSVTAHGLSNILKVDILAPSDILWIGPDGEMRISRNKGSNDGKWVKFTPKVR